MNYDSCPKCDGSLGILQSTGRQVCSSCKWIEPVKKTSNQEDINSQSNVDSWESEAKKEQENYSSEQIVNNNQKESIIQSEQKDSNSGAKTLFIIGILVTLYGLNYDTTTCDYDYGFKSGCTHNIGLLNDRSNIVNIGGFLGVCGCILSTKSKNK